MVIQKLNNNIILIFLAAVDCHRPNEIDNGRVIVVNDVTTYGGSAEYHCIPQYNRIGPYLRKCMDDGRWSGDEPRCECKFQFNQNQKIFKIQLIFCFISVAVNDAQDDANFGTGVAISAAIIVILLIFILIVFLHR
jgi:hypothetical protein